MKKIGILIFAAALVIGLVVSNLFSFGRAAGNMFNFSVNFGGGVRGSGNIITDKRDLSDFQAVEVGGVYQVEITAQKEFGVEIDGDDNLVALVNVVVSDGVLKISSEQKLSPKSPIRIRISAPDINELKVSGAASVMLNDIKNDGLSIDSSGASKIKVTGETAKLNVDVSGATKIDAENLKAGDVNVDASGACSVTVNVSGELEADASGASRVTYSGTPTSVEKKTSGASSVSQK